MMKDETLVVSSFFLCGEGGGECFPKEVAPLRSLLPSKIFKKFFRVGVWGGFEWVGGVGNSGFVVGTVLGHHTPLSKNFSFLQM